MSLYKFKDYYVPNYTDNILSLPILSEYKDNIYNVTIFLNDNFNFDFHCNCNEKKSYSKKCIHINNLISLIINNYESNSIKMNNNFLNNFNNINILSNNNSIDSDNTVDTCSTCSINSELTDCSSIDTDYYSYNYYMNNNIHNESIIPFSNIKSELLISIKSFVSSDIYLVSIKYNKNIRKFQYSCTCGLKFINKKRKKCKHISLIICSFF